MKKRYSALLFCCAVMLQSSAFALEASSSVKVETVLKADKSWDGKPLSYPQGQAQITGLIIEIIPGGETGWHLHPVPSFGMVLEGELDVSLKDGSVKHLKKGDTLAEVVNTLHNGKNTGSTPLKLLVFYAGAVDSKLTIKEEKH